MLKLSRTSGFQSSRLRKMRHPPSTERETCDSNVHQHPWAFISPPLRTAAFHFSGSCMINDGVVPLPSAHSIKDFPFDKFAARCEASCNPRESQGILHVWFL